MSFHETKNVISGEGGALLVNAPELVKRAEIIREKGTNRAAFFRGEVDKYTWVAEGSSYVLSDVLAALDADADGSLTQAELLLDTPQKQAIIAGRLSALGLANMA